MRRCRLSSTLTYTVKVLSKVALRRIQKRVRPASPALNRQILAFTAQIDWLAERLTPPRRPQDAREPECSRTELRILSVLGRNEPVSMTDLAGSLDIPLSTVTRAIDKLVTKGLVERGGVVKDRRIVQVGFSPRGREIDRFVVRSRFAIARSLLRALSTEDRARLLRLLARLAARPEKH